MLPAYAVVTFEPAESVAPLEERIPGHVNCRCTVTLVTATRAVRA